MRSPQNINTTSAQRKVGFSTQMSRGLRKDTTLLLPSHSHTSRRPCRTSITDNCTTLQDFLNSNALNHKDRTQTINEPHPLKKDRSCTNCTTASAGLTGGWGAVASCKKSIKQRAAAELGLRESMHAVFLVDSAKSYMYLASTIASSAFYSPFKLSQQNRLCGWGYFDTGWS